MSDLPETEQPDPRDYLPDVRDGLTRRERVVLYCLHEAQKELGGRNVPTVMLYGRVVEYMDMSEAELQSILQRFIGFDR
ncbi:MAG: hypothetical protein VYA55_01260 [Pseudomonadota bacterium]|nr:hypothetical protein [Pseudomonadota bacterium]